MFLLLSGGLARGNQRSVQLETAPPGAALEINGRVVCTTPCSITVDDSYFGKKHTVFGAHADEPIRVRFTKEGYVPKDVELTTGPIHWRSIACKFSGTKCQNSFDYYLLSADHFTFQLDPIQTFIGGSQPPTVSAVSAPSGNASIEEVVQKTLAAVVEIKAGNYIGSGFFVSANGVVATNAHVVHGEPSVLVTTSSGKLLQSTKIYVDQERDLALVKVTDEGNSFLRLSLTTPAPGSDVIAIGTPGVHDATGIVSLPNTVTKGVVSGIRRFPDSSVAAVPGRAGIWIQTDAAINHGNSGGPLLNRAGEVVGINTLTGNGTPGLNFALAASELAQLLQYRFGVKPDSAASPTHSFQSLLPLQALATGATGEAKAHVTSSPSGGEIYVDGIYFGNTPSDITLPAGEHFVRVTLGGKEWTRTLQITAGEIHVHAEMPAP